MNSRISSADAIRVAAALALCLGLVIGAAQAADHAEAPATQLDMAADLADVYAWHDGASDRLVTMLTIPGELGSDGRERPIFDRGVLYSIHIDRDGDFVEDATINVRFFRGFFFGGWVMAVEGMPGAPPIFVAPTERRVRIQPGVMAFAGLRDDPFFFDLQGFTETLQTGTLSFDGTRDGFAGRNVTALAFEMPLSAAANGASTLNIWATTARR